MQKMKILGGACVSGEIKVSGAKNSALPLMCAALLTSEPVTLLNVPCLRDVRTMLDLLRGMGVKIWDEGAKLTLDSSGLNSVCAPYECVKTMRASILVLGPLLARCGQAKVSLPGGCAIGARPVDLHIRGLEQLNAKVSVDHGYLMADATHLKGGDINLEMVTVTGTANLMMAAVLAEGETVICNAAQEPEVIDLAACLISMGAKISGAGTARIVIQGVKTLHGTQYQVMADRIEAGTYLCAAAITRGKIELQDAPVKHLGAVIDKLRLSGCQIEARCDGSHLSLQAPEKLTAVDISTAPYPGFPTDMQAQFMAINCVAQGQAVITETIFENRFMHAVEMMRMGADIKVKGNTATVSGIKSLDGATVMATDLRASAGLVIAALGACGQSVIERIYHLDRGYECLEEKLQALGACAIRVQR